MRLLCVIILCVSVLILISGCGDDDTATNAFVPQVFVDGTAQLTSNRLGVTMKARPYGGVAYLELDSAKVGDSLCELSIGKNWGLGDKEYFIAFYEKPGVTSEYESGDIARISIYSGNRAGHCSIKLLDEVNDKVEYIAPEQYHKAEIGDTVKVVWSKNEHAEWYAIHIEIYYDSAGVYSDTIEYLYTMDTTMALQNEFTSETVSWFLIAVIPMTGPDPSSKFGNWTGDLAVGWLYSYALYSYNYIYVTGQPPVGLNPDDFMWGDSVRSAENMALDAIKALTAKANIK